MISLPRRIAPYALAAILAALASGMNASAQALSVLPVNIHMEPGEQATTLTVTNQGTDKTAVQIRAYAWNQDGDNDQLTPSSEVVVAPPIASIAPGDTQVVRLILRKPPKGKEATYRIILDQIPPAAEPGVVHVVLRLSIPIFAQPTTRALAHVDFSAEVKDGQAYLVGINDGLRHEAIRDIELTTGDGRKMKVEAGASPYILAGTTRHWKIDAPDAAPLSSDTLRLTARSDAGNLEQQVQVVAAP
jgi:fimbrial chaperone protein